MIHKLIPEIFATRKGTRKIKMANGDQSLFVFSEVHHELSHTV